MLKKVWKSVKHHVRLIKTSQISIVIIPFIYSIDGSMCVENYSYQPCVVNTIQIPISVRLPIIVNIHNYCLCMIARLVKAVKLQTLELVGGPGSISAETEEQAQKLMYEIWSHVQSVPI